MSATKLLKLLVQDDRGATAVEYGIILAMIVIAMIAALQGFATSATTMWNNVETKVQDAREANASSSSSE